MPSEHTIYRFGDTNLPPDLPKRTAVLCRTDRMFGAVQVIRKGGENNLHAHGHLDGMWTVLSGKARFYGEGDAVLAELGAQEGIMIPRGFKYWFECASDDEPLVILQVECSDIPMRTMKDITDDRVDFAARRPHYDAVLAASEFAEKPPAD
jgi:mannose-6-phosphate isomerase-like protein (cupin superfamily)